MSRNYNNASSSTKSHQAGKGDADTRVKDRKKYRENYDEIDWSAHKKKDDESPPNKDELA